MNGEKRNKIMSSEELDDVLPKYEPVKLSGKNLAQQYVSAFNTGMNIYQCVNYLQGSIDATINGVNNVVKSWNDSVDETLTKSIGITKETTTEQFNKEWTAKQPELIEQVNTLTTNQFNEDWGVLENRINTTLETQNTNIENIQNEQNELETNTNNNINVQNTKINSIQTQQNNLASNQTNLANQQTTLSNRMDTFTSLSQGSTTGDAELKDIRVGANGVTYPNAGDAVRGQYSQLKEDLGNFSTLVYEDALYNLQNLFYYKDLPFESGYYYEIINGNLSKTVNSNYSSITKVIKIKPNSKITITKDSLFITLTIDMKPIEVHSNYTTNISVITAEENAEYLIISVHNESLSNGYIKTNSLNNLLDVAIKPNDKFVNAYFMANNENEIEIYNFNGYLTKNGDLIFDKNIYGKYTNYIHCKKGDNFYYNGLGEYEAASWLFYNDATLVSFGQSKNKTIVEIPEGVNGVIFSSYSTNNVTLDVYRINNDNFFSNVLYGKKYVACGDSFTHGDFTSVSNTTDNYDYVTNQYKTYPWHIAKRNGMNLINLAVNGSKTSDFMNIYKNIPTDADYITIAYGLNDYSNNMPIGTIDDTEENTTFMGYLNTAFTWISKNIPFAHVGIVIMPAYMGNDYRVAQEALARKYGFAVLNMYNANVPMFMNKDGADRAIQSDKYNKFIVSETNSHPNEKAHKFMSTFIENFLRSI